MTLEEAIRTQYSVRQYLEKSIEAEKNQQLKDLIDECNREGCLHIQLVTNEPKARTRFALLNGYAPIDLGIAKCHFEIGAGKENFEWL
ncbi:MAG: hypothetical protein IKM85_04555 [Bacteroidales bacterium]|nr:hypothetical protein [Bacteroidales bacterium]